MANFPMNTDTPACRSKGEHDHIEANRQRLNRREALFNRLDKIYEQLAHIEHAG